MVALPPLARDFVPMPLPMTLVFASTLNDVSLPSAVTVSVVGATDLTVADARSLVLPAADAPIGNARSKRRGRERDAHQAIHGGSFGEGRGRTHYQISAITAASSSALSRRRCRQSCRARPAARDPSESRGTQAEHRQREDARQTAHERVGERQRRAVDAHDAQLTDDAADRGLPFHVQKPM